VAWFKGAIRVLYAFFVALMLLGAVRSGNFNVYGLPDVMVLAGVVIVIIVISLLFFVTLRQTMIRNLKMAIEFIQSHYKVCAAVLLVLVFMYQTMLIFTIRSYWGFDVGLMYECMILRLHGLDSYADIYLSHYPNNHLYYLLMYVVSLFTGEPHIFVWDFLNLFCIDVSIILFSLAAQRKYGKKHGFTTLVSGCLLLGFSPYVLIPYTDTITLPFVSAGLLFLSGYKPEISTAKQAISGVLIGCMVALAYLMKPSSCIPFMASAMIFIFWTASKLFAESTVGGNRLDQTRIISVDKESASREKINVMIKAGTVMLTIALSFTGVNVIFKSVVKHQTVFDYNAESRFPLTHFIMMGMGEPWGGFSDDDVEATINAGDYSQKIDHNLSVIKTRLTRFGLPGYIRFLVAKFDANTADGSFHFRREGVTSNYNDQVLKGWLSQTLGKIYFLGGPYFSVYLFYSQTVWVFVVFFMLKSLRHSDSFTSMLQLSLIGGLIFLLIFEGGRSRYLVQFLPVICILASLGFGTGLNDAATKNLRSAKRGTILPSDRKRSQAI
jgi:hypothetical protein